MKFEYDERDLHNIENINRDLEKGEDVPLFVNQTNHEYYINFTCLDRAKANNFIGMLLSSNEEAKKEVEEKLGIKVNYLSYCEGDTKISELKAHLKGFMERLDIIANGR